MRGDPNRSIESCGFLSQDDGPDVYVRSEALPEGITCDATLWAACIGGAMQEEAYVAAIEAVGLRVQQLRDNPQYLFISRNAQGAAKKFGVKVDAMIDA